MHSKLQKFLNVGRCICSSTLSDESFCPIWISNIILKMFYKIQIALMIGCTFCTKFFDFVFQAFQSFTYRKVSISPTTFASCSGCKYCCISILRVVDLYFFRGKLQYFIVVVAAGWSLTWYIFLALMSTMLWRRFILKLLWSLSSLQLSM